MNPSRLNCIIWGRNCDLCSEPLSSSLSTSRMLQNASSPVFLAGRQLDQLSTAITSWSKQSPYNMEGYKDNLFSVCQRRTLHFAIQQNLSRKVNSPCDLETPCTHMLYNGRVWGRDLGGHHRGLCVMKVRIKFQQAGTMLTRKENPQQSPYQHAFKSQVELGLENMTASK